MIKKLRHRSLLAAISFLALLVLMLGVNGSGAVQAGTRHSAAILGPGSFELFVTITGAKQGQFKGESIQRGFTNTIPAFNFSFALSFTPSNGTGNGPSGKLDNAPVTITKNVGAASPQILQAIATDETLTTVLFQFYQVNMRGILALHHTVKLTHAFFINFKQYLPQQNGPEFEDISFSYGCLEYTQDGSTTTTGELCPEV